MICYTNNNVDLVKDKEYNNCELLFKGLHFNGDNFDIILEITNISDGTQDSSMDEDEANNETLIENTVQEEVEILGDNEVQET